MGFFGLSVPESTLSLVSVCEQVSSAKLSLEELRKEVVRDTSKTERLKTQKAIRTLEYKRHRVSSTDKTCFQNSPSSVVLSFAVS